MGRGHQFRRSRFRPGARILRRQCGLLDRRVSSRRAAARRDAGNLRSIGRSYYRRRCAAGAIGGRSRITFVVGENEPQHAKLARPPERGGYGLDALWNDDFHHSAMVALTGHHEAYYSDYRGRPREFVAAAKYGFLYQGQRYQWQRKARGTPTFDLPAECFVVFLQNHDQIANSGTGGRCHALTSPGRLRAMTAYLLLMPGIPMLFQGQEFAASSPFFYFADHETELSHDVREGR